MYKLKLLIKLKEFYTEGKRFFKRTYHYIKNKIFDFIEFLKEIDYKEKTKQFLRLEFVQYVVAFLLSLYARLVYATSKIEISGKTNDYLNCVLNKKATIAMCWHGKIFLSGAVMEKLLKKINYKKSLLVLSSKHKDGEIASKTLGFFNFKKIGGSTINSTKLHKHEESGAVRSIMILIKELKNKSSIFLSPDGPRGPIHEMNSSIVEIAAKSEAIIFTVHIDYSKKFVLHTWDKFEIPLPFSKIKVDFNNRFDVNKNTNIEETNAKIKGSL